MVPPHKSTGHFPRWVWAFALLVPIGLVVGWVVAQGAREPTEARWSMSDLPAAPHDRDNGWTIFRDEELPTAIDDAIRERLDELLDADVPVSERIRSFDRISGTLRMESERHGPARDVVERALGRPRFADACSLEAGMMCPSLELLAVVSVVALRSFDLASEGRLQEALSLAMEALRAHLDLAATARTYLTMTIASLAVSRDVALIEDLVHLVGRSDVPAESWSAQRRELRALLADRPPIDAAQAVRGEYVYARAALSAMIAEARRSRSLGLDARATSEAIDEYYTALHDYAEDPSLPAPPEPSAGTSFWRYNPIGDLLLQGLLFDSALRIDQLRETDAEIDAQIETLRLETLARALPTEGSPEGATE